MILPLAYSQLGRRFSKLLFMMNPYLENTWNRSYYSTQHYSSKLMQVRISLLRKYWNGERKLESWKDDMRCWIAMACLVADHPVFTWALVWEPVLDITQTDVFKFSTVTVYFISFSVPHNSNTTWEGVMVQPWWCPSCAVLAVCFGISVFQNLVMAHFHPRLLCPINQDKSYHMLPPRHMEPADRIFFSNCCTCNGRKRHTQVLSTPLWLGLL